MEIKAVNCQAGKLQLSVIQKTNFFDPGNSSYGSVGCFRMQVKVSNGRGIKGDTTATRIKYEIECIGKIIQPCVQNYNPPGKLCNTKPRQQA